MTIKHPRGQAPAPRPSTSAQDTTGGKDGIVRLRLPYPPQANHFKTALVINGRARMVKSKAARDYAEAVTDIAHAAGVTMFTGPVCVRVDAYRPRRVGDLDNVLKVGLDSLTGIVYADDAQIVEIAAFRHDDKNDPHLMIEVRAKEQS